MASRRKKTRVQRPSFIWNDDGVLELVIAADAAGKRARGKCVVHNCRTTVTTPRARICSKCAMLRWRANNKVLAAIANCRQRALRKGLAFDLTKENIGPLLEASGYLANKGSLKHQLHIDRKIPALGYIHTNVQILTCSENTAKGNQERRVEYGMRWRANHPEAAQADTAPDEELPDDWIDPPSTLTPAEDAPF